MKVLAKRTKKDAERKTEAVDRLIKEMEGSWWKLAKMIQACIDQHVPAAMGLTFTTWIEARFGKRKLSDAFRKLRIVRALKALPEYRVKALPESNAYSLSRLSEKDRKDRKWLTAAETTPVAEFEERVEKHIEQKTGMARERFVHWFPTMPEADSQLLEDAESKLAKLFGFDLKQQPGLRVEIWRRVAIFMVTTEDEHLIVESEGAWNQPSPKPNGAAAVAKDASASKISPSHVPTAASSGS